MFRFIGLGLNFGLEGGGLGLDLGVEGCVCIDHEQC